jgi:hypothetical protein
MIGIVVANVPEGLLPQMTVALTLTAQRMYVDGGFEFHYFDSTAPLLRLLCWVLPLPSTPSAPFALSAFVPSVLPVYPFPLRIIYQSLT